MRDKKVMQGLPSRSRTRGRILFQICFPVLFVVFSSITFPQDFEIEKTIAFGDVMLEDVTREYGLLRFTATFGAAAFDANNDEWPDIVVSNHGKPPSIYINIPGSGFVSLERELLRLPGADRHAPSVADYDNDGDADLFIQHGAKSGTGLGPKELFINQGHGKPFKKSHNVLIADPKGRGRTAVWFDYDSDGLLDLYLANGFREDASNRLFRNAGNGNFVDKSAASGLNVRLNTSSGSAVAGDIDNDGDMDLLLNSVERPYLFVNNGRGEFRDETEERGIPLIHNIWSTSIADYNADGLLDIYLVRGSELSLEGAMLGKHRLNFLQQVKAGGDHTDILTFQSDPAAELTFEFFKSLFTSFVDIDNIYVGEQGRNPRRAKFIVGRNALSPEGIPKQWRPDGTQKGTFIWRDGKTGRWFIAAATGQSDVFVSGGLVTTDSFLFGLRTDGMESTQMPKYRNMLLKNQNGRFTDVTATTRVLDASNSHGSVWMDLDNDGDQELFVVNAGFNGRGKQPNTLYLNLGGGRYRQFRIPMIGDERFGRGDGVVSADFNRDGLLDLFLVNGAGALPNSRGPYQLFLNKTKLRNCWIGFRLVGGGRNYTNRDAVGAKVQVLPSAGPPSSWQFILGGSGSSSQSSRILHFGLGRAGSIVARIHWPPSKTFPAGHVNVLHLNRTQFNRNYVIHER